MTNVYELPPHKQRMDEASEWIARLDNKLSAEDEKAFQVWMAADPENQNTLLEMAELWDNMDCLSRLVDLFPEPVIQKKRRHWQETALAATILIAVLTGILVAQLPELPPDMLGREVPESAMSSFIVYETAVGEHSSINLPDGTQLILNTNSLIRVNYTDAHRLLVLESGELSVNVADDKNRPFSVIAGNRIVQAVGTEFNLEITSDQQIELVVTEGRVRVGVHKSQRGPRRGITPTLLSSSALTVSAGQEFLLGASEEDIKEIQPEEVEVKLSWRNGNLIFQGESLEEAISEIGRYTSVEFVFLDDDLKKVRIAGLFRAGDVDGLLATLRENFDISYERTSEGKVLLSSQ